MARLKKNWLKLLSEADIVKIDAASRQVLTEVGIRFEDATIRSMLLDKGCTDHNGRLQLTNEVIDAALAAVQGEMTFGSRSGKKLTVKEGRVTTHTGGSIPYCYDMDIGGRREAKLDDLVDMVRLMNGLDALGMTGALVMPMDVPPAISEVVQVATLLRHCQKPMSGTAISTAPQARYIVELLQAMANVVEDLDTYPLFVAGISPESPLYFPQNIVDIMKAFIPAGIPTMGLVAPIVGLTAPMTISGGLTQMNACILAYTVISHQINPTTPVIYGARLAVANMSTAASVWGVPEVGLNGASSVQLARHYGFISDVYGLSSTSCTHDTQLGYEAAVNCLLPMLAGANIISGFGSFGSGYMASCEKLVSDNELVSMLLRVAQGVAVDEDRLAVDVIAAAMGGQDYVLQPHTMKHLRGGELFQPKIGNYGLFKHWEEEGARDLATVARDEARRVLEAQKDQPLPDDVSREFERIITAAEKELT